VAFAVTSAAKASSLSDIYQMQAYIDPRIRRVFHAMCVIAVEVAAALAITLRIFYRSGEVPSILMKSSRIYPIRESRRNYSHVETRNSLTSLFQRIFFHYCFVRIKASLIT
jgi:hypothetical protein